MLGCGKRANFNCYKGLGRMKNFIYTIYKQKCFLHLIQQPKYEMVMPCKADYSPAKSFYDVKNLSGLIYKEGGEAERLRTG